MKRKPTIKVCEVCEQSFEAKRIGQRFCSVACANTAQRTGRRAGRMAECEACGETFEATQEHQGYKRRYCSRACANKVRLASRPTFICATCGTSFDVAPSRATDRKYCSRSCFNADSANRKTGPSAEQADEWSETRRGRGNPAFKSGKWGNRARRSKFSLKLKGEECCRVCEDTRELHLHHMVPRSKAVAGRDDIRNGMTLCSSCHTSWHRRGLAIPRELLTDEERECVESLATPGWLEERYPVTGAETPGAAREQLRPAIEARRAA